MDRGTFYRWEKQAKEGMREALNGRLRRHGKAPDRILSDADLLYRRKWSQRSGEKPPELEPARPYRDLSSPDVEDSTQGVAARWETVFLTRPFEL